MAQGKKLVVEFALAALLNLKVAPSTYEMYWALNMRHTFPNLEANTTCFLLTIAGIVECALRYTCSIRAGLFKWDAS